MKREKVDWMTLPIEDENKTERINPMHSTEITIKTLTPLFTGGIDGTSELIHETGIMGSLRWWYEAIARGLGGSACNPVKNKCNFNNKVYKESKKENERDRLFEAGLCDACQIFGATGWKRRFQLEITDTGGELTWHDKTSLNIRPYGRTRGWYFLPGWTGTFNLILKGDKETISRLTDVIMFLEKWGTLGSKGQIGYGVFKVDHISGNSEKSTWEIAGEKAVGELPDFRTFTFFKLSFKPSSPDWWMSLDGFQQGKFKEDDWRKLIKLSNKNIIPVSPLIKNYLRFKKNWSHYILASWFFGNIKQDYKQKSKINLSWAYSHPDTNEWEIKGYVFFPQDNKGKRHFNEIRNELKKELGNPGRWFSILGLRESYPAKVFFLPDDSAWEIRGTGNVLDILKSIDGDGRHDK